MKSMSSRFLAAALAMLSALPSYAFFGGGSGIVYDPTHTAKTIAEGAKRAAEAAADLQMQINHYQNMIMNTLSLRDTAFAPLGDMLRSLHSVYMQGQSLMYRVDNLDSQFAYMYPGYASIYSMGTGGTTMTDLYKKWSDQGNENVRTAMLSAGIQVRDMESTDAMLQRLVSRSSTAGGQKAALQAGNEIAALNTQQLQKLQALISTQIDLQTNYLAQQNHRQSVYDARYQHFHSAPVTNSPAKTYDLY